MDMTARHDLRDFIGSALKKHGDHGQVADDESLFVSGRLDSLSMMNLVVYLEDSFGLDFSRLDFDVDLVDSIDEIASLVDSNRSG
jgi:acyl carrier protein